MGDSLDEGNEIWNETSEEWIGVDECLLLSDGTYWDDEFKQDLDCLTYGRLVVSIMACYSGGLIDDLSGENRIIMTAANETYTGVTDAYTEEGGFDAGGGSISDRYCEWTEALIDSLHGGDTYYNPLTYAIVHKNVTIQADSNQDGHISMLEAWQYAWDHDEGRIDKRETNWLDDNNNRLPTYINGCDNATGPCDNGNLAAAIWFPPRHYNLTVQTYDYWYNSEISGADVWVDSGYVDESPVMVNMSSGHVWHNVTAAPVFYMSSIRYTFQNWEDNSTSNSRFVHLDSNQTITAYYVRDWYGGGCPYLSVWNGTHYVLDNNLLRDAEASNGTEVEDFYRLEQALTPVREVGGHSLYSLSLSEFEHEHSFFDQVKLFAVDHEADTNVAVSPSGEILTYQNPQAPLSAVDDQGVDRIALVHQPDGVYYQGYSSSFLVLNFGEVDAEAAKLVLRADRDLKLSIHVQTLNPESEWVDAAVVVPRTYWATEIVDLSSCLPTAGEFKVRLYFMSDHKLDYVGLDTTSQAEISLQEAHLLLAVHSEEWRVTTRLLGDDDIYVELIPDQQIILLFAVSKPSQSNRTFIFYTKGYYYSITS
jgi:hypothetical protein